jgi:CRISPR-associated protein Cmr2
MRPEKLGISMAHLLIVTLGPIQDFIAAARRTRDLWFGSWLLSELSKATARAMAEECGLDSLVFPGVSHLSELTNDSTSVANKIVVRVPAGKEPSAVAERGKAGMQARLERLREEAFQEIEPVYFKVKNARLQVNDLIEFTWVSTPEHEEDYADARRRAESLLSARKNTRLWNPVAWGSEAPKSSIDGERESVLHEDLFDKVSPEDIRRRYGVGPSERLCGVGLFKRHGTRPSNRYSHRFLSTGHLAAWPLYRRTKEVHDPALAEAWKLYLNALEKGGVHLVEQEIYQGKGWSHPVFGIYDGSLLFDNRLPELFEEVSDLDRRQAGLKEARAALAKVHKELDVAAPLPYYAILVADGDHMGKAIERQDSFQEHKDLSQALDRFSQSVRTTVETDHGGELVYAGGDDVLAFVPLHRAVACARDLAGLFRKRLERFVINEKGDTPTLSAGIGISHFLDPLRRALDLAKKAEKLAKVERNSLAVIVDKRSGPPVKVKGEWGTVDKRLDDYVTLHRADQVPDGAAYELRELGRLLEGVEDGDKENLTKLVRKEAERILKRKQPEHGEKEKIDPAILERLLKDLDDSSIPEVADRLIVARLLAQAADEAGEPLPEKGGLQ